MGNIKAGNHLTGQMGWESGGCKDKVNKAFNLQYWMLLKINQKMSLVQAEVKYASIEMCWI